MRPPRGFVSRGSPCAYAHRDAWQDDEDGYGTPDDGSGSANRTAARFIGHEEHGHEPVARPRAKGEERGRKKRLAKTRRTRACCGGRPQPQRRKNGTETPWD